jgi:cell division protein FtsQ
MRQSKTPLRGSVTQNVSARARESDGIGFLARLGLLGVFVLIFMIVAAVGWHSGWFAKQTERLRELAVDATKKADFQVKDIVVEGRKQSSKDDLFSALSVKRGLPIFAVNIDEASANLGKLPWVDAVRVERRLPDTIAVLLTERKPMARWQVNEKFYVIDTEGKVLATAKADNFPNLPQVVGAGADKKAGDFLALLKKEYPEILEKTDSSVRVGERRWDLFMSRRVTVRLPEGEAEMKSALRRLSVLMAEEKILDRNITSIDLRFPDRLVLEPVVEAKPAGEKRP